LPLVVYQDPLRHREEQHHHLDKPLEIKEVRHKQATL
jgi:hypothetical protein